MQKDFNLVLTVWQNKLFLLLALVLGTSHLLIAGGPGKFLRKKYFNDNPPPPNVKYFLGWPPPPLLLYTIIDDPPQSFSNFILKLNYSWRF